MTSWPSEYPDEFRALLPDLGGYAHYRDGDVPGSPGGYYVVAQRRRYDFHDPARAPRGLLVASRDPLGAETVIDYDTYGLLPVRVTDPAGLTTLAGYDYRVLQASAITDANGNTASFAFSPAGFLAAQFARGRNGEGDGANPSVRMEYDLLAFGERHQPISVRTTRRVHHDSEADVPAPERDETIASVEYSDGYGRLLQTRAQAEDTTYGDPVFGGNVIGADQSVPITDTVGQVRQAGEPDVVVVSGWQVYDNKGRVVQKYEPFFARGYAFSAPEDGELGQKATIFYDPRGRAVRTTNPDGSEQRVVFGVPADLANPDDYAPTPWESHAYDANDDAGRTHGDAASAYRAHWNTPASIVVDSLGRTVAAVARNGADPAHDWYVTRSSHDIQGNHVATTDCLGRVAFRAVFDLAKRRWRVDSIDAGRRDVVLDAAGNTVEGRDSKGALTLHGYDALRRPARLWARDDAASAVTLRQRLDYGDAGRADQPLDERRAARDLNLLGQLARHHDEAGLTTMAAVDFKGNVLDKSRRVIADGPILAAFQHAAANGWQVAPFQVDWQPRDQQALGDREAELLEPAAYQTTASYDALNRLKRVQFPQDVEGKRRELRPEYNRAGGLDRVWLDDVPYVERIAYDAKGQRALVAYGNGVMTRYAYDPRTFRLTRLRSERYTKPDAATYRPGGEPLQDYVYDCDLVGNILGIQDRAPGSGIPNNPDALSAGDPALAHLLASGDALRRRFDYDPLYRLLAATGRECDVPPDGAPWADQPRCVDRTRARAYTERYAYDPMGSVLRLEHRNDAAGLTRVFTVGAGSNRLQTMEVGDAAYDYTVDASGNMRSETTSRHFEWSYADQMKAFRTQTEGAEPSVYAHYLYDAAGGRVKKLVRKQGGQVEVTHYVDAAFEHHRWGGPSSPGENNHVHVMDDQRRVALVRLGPAHQDDGGPAVQLHLGDHLGSSNVVVDSGGAPVNREEYTPYGETSFGSFAKKRYRFTGKERDEESGIAYHRARYYMAWITRWSSPDTLGPVDGLNLYRYAKDNPVAFSDPSGTQAKPDVDQTRAPDTNDASSHPAAATGTPRSQEQEKPSAPSTVGGGASGRRGSDRDAKSNQRLKTLNGELKATWSESRHVLNRMATIGQFTLLGNMDPHDESMADEFAANDIFHDHLTYLWQHGANYEWGRELDQHVNSTLADRSFPTERPGFDEGLGALSDELNRQQTRVKN